MAKQRIVNTRFWDDSYIARMSPEQKLVFLYLLTNPLTNIAGVYEISAKRASFDVGLPVKVVNQIFDQLEKDGKIVREDDWLGIINFIRYQSQSPKIRTGIRIELERAPQALVERLPVDLDTLSIPLDRLSHSNPNSNSNPNFNRSLERMKSPTYPPGVGKKREELIKKMSWKRR